MAAPTYLDLDVMLRQAAEARASDLHIRVGIPPSIRVDGALRALEGYNPVTKEQSADLANRSITEGQKRVFRENKSLDFSYAIPDLARFRCAYFLQQGLISLVYRRIPDTIPSLAGIRAPAILLEWARLSRGLVLVTGPTGSGKTTTLAAVLDVINAERTDHILTLEDPIEFVHQPNRCVINQREIGRDVPNFAQGLRAALRQDPDVILVGELRDLETMATAISAAETGHLVFGTVHTSTADSTIARVIDQYPADQQQQIRTMLASSLVGVVTQALLPRADGPGRIACFEVMVCNTAIRNHIRHQQMEQVRGAMQTSTKSGMQTMDLCLAYYVHLGLLDLETARGRAVSLQELEDTLAAFRRGQDVAVPETVQPGYGSMARRALPGEARRSAPLPMAGKPPLPDSAAVPMTAADGVSGGPSSEGAGVSMLGSEVDLAAAEQASAHAVAALEVVRKRTRVPASAPAPPLPPDETDTLSGEVDSAIVSLLDDNGAWMDDEDSEPPKVT